MIRKMFGRKMLTILCLGLASGIPLGIVLTVLQAWMTKSGINLKMVGLAVLIYQPNPQTVSFGSLPFYYLAKLDAQYFFDAATAHSPVHISGPAEKVWI